MELARELAQFTGTEQYYKGLGGVKRTDGVQFLTSKASWAVTDVEVILTHEPKVRKEEFVSITIQSKDKKAAIVYGDGNGNVLFSQVYGYTDLDEGEYKLFYTNGVLMLSSEY